MSQLCATRALIPEGEPPQAAVSVRVLPRLSPGSHRGHDEHAGVEWIRSGAQRLSWRQWSGRSRRFHSVGTVCLQVADFLLH